jgi:hypothetical protein
MTMGWLTRIVERWQAWRAARRAAMMFEREVVVTQDDDGVRVVFPTGESRVIRWSDIDVAAIETNDSGPWGADVWWVLEGAGERMAWPQGATGDEAMLPTLRSRLAGFSDMAVVDAMGCTDNARFVCWARSPDVTDPS